MDEHLVGYLLNNLDQAAQQRVEGQLRNDPQARRRLELLRRMLAPLEEDRHIQPPPDLAIKTLARVAEHLCRELPKLPRPVSRTAPAPARSWRRVDVLVAASLLFGVVTLSFPLISRWRHNHAIVECQKNLGDFYLALASYRDIHKAAPNFADNPPPRNVAGMIAPILHDAKVLPDTVSICCPAIKGAVPCAVTLAKIGSLTPEEFQQEAPRLLPCYAFSLGYRENGVYYCPMDPLPDIPSARVPLMADRPPLTGMGNSPNHGGQGQNVLFQDGHVEYILGRKIGTDGDDIYLNRYMKVAAGIGCADAVLGSSAAQP